MSRRTALKRGLATTAAVAVGVPALSGQAAAATIVVPDDHSTIQGAVDAASPGDTVVVEAGTYREQVRIDEDLTLEGRSGAILEATDSLPTYELVESGSSWAPMLFAHGGSVSGGTVSGSGTVDVDVSGLELDGRGNTGQAGRKTGILYRNVGGSNSSTISETTVSDLGVPGNSIGIVAYGDSDVRFEDNVVDGFGRGGIGANGDGGAHPSPSVEIRNNEMDAGADPGGSAPNGIQVGFGATGDAKRNTVKNCRYATDTDGLWQASGVLVFESDGVRVQDNTIENCDVAAAVSAWGWFRSSASNCKVTKNDVEDALIGVNLRATAWDQDGGLAFLTSENPSVDNNKVVNNDLDDPDGGPTGDIGIAIERNDQNEEDGYEPSVDNNKTVRNDISGFDEGIVDEGSGTKVAANVIEP